jgi:hypothetical protein
VTGELALTQKSASTSRRSPYRAASSGSRRPPDPLPCGCRRVSAAPGSARPPRMYLAAYGQAFPCALRSDRPKHRRASLRASVSADRSALVLGQRAAGIGVVLGGQAEQVGLISEVIGHGSSSVRLSSLVLFARRREEPIGVVLIECGSRRSGQTERTSDASPSVWRHQCALEIVAFSIAVSRHFPRRFAISMV